MKKNIMKVALVAAFALFAGYNVYTSCFSRHFSDVLLSNLEALATVETGDEFTDATDCVAVWEDVTCRGKDNLLYSFATADRT